MTPNAPRPTAQALREIYRAAVLACDAGAMVEARLRRAPLVSPAFVFALGKPALALAAGARRALGEGLLGGLVVGPRGAGRSRALPFVPGDHPYPGASSARAGGALLARALSLPPGVPVLVLLAGGGSALAVVPAQGLGLAAKLRAHRALLASGLPIQAVNGVRAHLSRLKGSGLLRAFGPRPVRLEVLSDVGAGELSPVASGPCSPDPTTFAEGLALLRDARVSLPEEAQRRLEEGALGLWPETAKPGDPIFDRVSAHPLAGPEELLRAAAELARAQGFRVIERAAPVACTVEEVAQELERLLAARPPRQPTVFVAVGEPTVALPRSAGMGGRAQQLALSMALLLPGRNAAFLAAGSDGRDGPSPYAGAAVDSGTALRAAALGVSLDRALARFDASPAVARLRVGIPAGPPRTNLTDLLLLGFGGG